MTARQRGFWPDGSRVALLDKGGWEGGVDGYIAKMEKGRKAGLAKQEAAKKAREKAAKKIPPKTDKTSTPAGFTDNLDEALAKAKAEGKLVYACFSGSDWCYWCKKLEEEVLSDPLFVAGVMDDYVLVFIDSPQNKARLSDHAKAEKKKADEEIRHRGLSHGAHPRRRRQKGRQDRLPRGRSGGIREASHGLQERSPIKTG